MTKKQLLYKLKRIVYKHFHDYGGIEKLRRKGIKDLPTDALVYLDIDSIVDEIYNSMEKTVLETGKLP